MTDRQFKILLSVMIRCTNEIIHVLFYLAFKRGEFGTPHHPEHGVSKDEFTINGEFDVTSDEDIEKPEAKSESEGLIAEIRHLRKEQAVYKWRVRNLRKLLAILPENPNDLVKERDDLRKSLSDISNREREFIDQRDKAEEIIAKAERWRFRVSRELDDLVTLPTEFNRLREILKGEK